jgi:hypothetical protein
VKEVEPPRCSHHQAAQVAAPPLPAAENTARSGIEHWFLILKIN